MPASKVVTEKKAYERPVLCRYGTIEQITLRGMDSSSDSAGSNRRPSNVYSGWA